MKQSLLTKINTLNKHSSRWISIADDPIFDEKRILPTSIISIKTFGNNFVQSLVFNKTTLWLFGVDKYYDERMFSSRELKKISVHLPYLKKTDQFIVDLGLGKTSCLLRNVVSSHLSYVLKNKNILHFLEGEIRNTLLGMDKETETKNNYQNTNDYLENARYSIGVHVVLLLVSLSYLKMKLSEIKGYLPIFLQCAEIIRLKNDIVTNDKELIEGKINSIRVLENQGMSFKEAEKEVLKQIIGRMNNLEEFYRNKYSYYNSQIVKWSYELVRCVLEFYEENDFYDDKKDLLKYL